MPVTTDTHNKARSRAHVAKPARIERTYHGENLAKPLLEWLNSHDRKKHDVVEALKREIDDLEQNEGVQIHGKRIKVKLVTLAPQKRMSLTFRPALTRLITRAGRRVWMFDWEPVNKSEEKAQIALVRLFELTSLDLVSHVRMCAKPGCNQWFWARFEKQQFHSKGCQQSTYHESPEYREKRRKYMRELRQLHKKEVTK